MKTKIVIIALSAFLTACEEGERCKVVELQEPAKAAKAQTIFLDCLSKVPEGPKNLTASGNDWDEVVSACREAAILLTREYREVCK